MTADGGPPLSPTSAATALANLGFVASSDLPDRPGPAYLLVALRSAPTLRHFDPELVEYWASEDRRGVRRSLTRATAMPLGTEVAWGLIRLVDRLRVSNDFLTFGGTVRADRVGDDVMAVFSSPVPILRRGGHSQWSDPGADSLGAWFGRLLLAVDYVPGFERRLAEADPVARYAAFLGDAAARYRASDVLRGAHPDLWSLLRGEEQRLRAEHPDAWRAGEELKALVARTAIPARDPAAPAA